MKDKFDKMFGDIEFDSNSELKNATKSAKKSKTVASVWARQRAKGTDEQRKENMSAGAKKRSSKASYLANLRKGQEKIDKQAKSEKMKQFHADNPDVAKRANDAAMETRKTQEYWDKYNEGISKRNNNPDWQKNVRAGGLKKSPPCSTPYGDWDHVAVCLRELSEKLGVGEAAIRSWFHKTGDKYKDWIIHSKKS